jgi:hypothetical protein
MADVSTVSHMRAAVLVAALMLCACVARTWRLQHVPLFNADEAEYALMATSVVHGERPANNFVAPTDRLLVGPVLWVGNGLWAALSDDTGPSTPLWLRLPNVIVSVGALVWFWRRRLLFARDTTFALCGLFLLATAVSEVLGARMAWDPGAYGLVVVGGIIAARTGAWMWLVLWAMFGVATHPMMIVLVPWWCVHAVPHLPLRWQRLGRWTMTTMFAGCALMFCLACVRGKALLIGFAFSPWLVLQSLPRVASVFSGATQLHEVAGGAPTATVAFAVVWMTIVLGMLGFGRSKQQLGWLASFVGCVALVGADQAPWRLLSMLSVPLLLEVVFAGQRIIDKAHTARTRVAALLCVVGMLQAGVVGSALVRADEDPLFDDVARVLQTNPTQIVAADWWAERPFLLVLRNRKEVPVVRMRPDADVVVDERTVLLVRDEDKEVQQMLVQQQRTLIPFRSSGVSYAAALPVVLLVVPPPGSP